MTYPARLLALLSYLSFLLLITSCKEDLLNNPIKNNTENTPSSTTFQQSDFPKFSDLPFEQAYPSAYRHLARQVQNIAQTNRNEYFLFSELDVDNYIVNTSPEGTSFVWYLPTTGSSSKLYYNLVIEKYPEGYDEPFILEYELSDEFNNLFNSGQASLNEFAGSVRKYLLEQVIGNRELTFEFCYELIFEDNGGGHGSYNDGPGTTTTTSSSSSNEGVMGLGGGGFFACIECVPCTCHQHYCGNSSCTCGQGGSGTAWFYVMANCGPSYYIQNNDDPQISGEGRGVLEDCFKILLDHGVMPPGYQHNDSENEEEDCAISEMKFIDENRFTLPGFKQKGVNLAECCEANDFDECAWEEISPKYNLDFNWEEYEDIVLTFLKDKELRCEDLLENEINPTDCIESDDFGKCTIDFLIEDSPEYIAVAGYEEAGLVDVYFKCADIQFSNEYSNGPVTPIRVSQIEVYFIVNTLLCIPKVSEAEGKLRNVDFTLKIEATMPTYLFSGPFGYANQQTNLATYYTEALNVATELGLAGITCNNVISKREFWRSEFFKHINDYYNKKAIWGTSAGSVNFKNTFQEQPPNNYQRVKSICSIYQSSLNCN